MPIAHDSLLYLRCRNGPRSEIAMATEGWRQLPTEDSLMRDFGVSRITVRRAIRIL